VAPDLVLAWLLSLFFPNPMVAHAKKQQHIFLSPYRKTVDSANASTGDSVN
jgi:hypothetical protein